MRRRLDIRAILRNEEQRRELMVDTIVATQAREGVTTTKAQALAAYEKVRRDNECSRTSR
jgi:hypothetical protein